MRIILVESPEIATVAAYLLLDRPDTLYINTACPEGSGIIMLIPPEIALENA